MTTDTQPSPPITSGEVSGQRTPMSRLIRVEVRKMVDTRAGRWMLIAMGAIVLIVTGALLIWGHPDEMTFKGFLSLNTLVLGVIMPVIGVMAGTAEWTQRTGLVTFTLEPRRGRVIVAKVVAAIVLGLVVIALAILTSAVAQAIAVSFRGANSGGWDGSVGLVLGVIAGLLIFVLQGLAFGFAFLNTPLAIVATFVLPTIWSAASSMATWLDKAAVWIDLNRVTGPLLDGELHGSDWAHLATGAAVWVGLPMAIGVWRVLHLEVK